jgi:hypothetical protein
MISFAPPFVPPVGFLPSDRNDQPYILNCGSWQEQNLHFFKTHKHMELFGWQSIMLRTEVAFFFFYIVA